MRRSMTLLKELGVGSELWSVSRGLARNVGRYKKLLRLPTSLNAGIDQIEFMRSLLDPSELMNRV